MTQLEPDPNRDAKSPGVRQYDAEDDALAHLHKMSGTGSAFAPSAFSFNGGTFAGGLGGGAPRMLSMIHFPRTVGAVRFA